MFRGCNALTSLDISGWDTSSAVSMLGMFNVDAASPLTDIILGEWFVLTDPGNNLFGTGTSERTNKIRVSCPENVYTQFENYSSYATGNEEYKKQVTWNHGSSAENFGEFLNPTIAVTSVSRTVNFTFTLGGYFDSEALTTIQVGFDGYTPADMTTYRFSRYLLQNS